MVLFLKIITKNEYFKLDFSGDFVTQSDDPDFMPDITGGDDYVDYNDYMNGDVLIPWIDYGESAFTISGEWPDKTLSLGGKAVIN